MIYVLGIKVYLSNIYIIKINVADYKVTLSAISVEVTPISSF